MILAAGYGTRLRPLTDYLPKPLFPILGRPVIWYQAKLLEAAGLADIVVNLHHLPGMIEEYAASGEFGFMKARFVREEGMILGTGGGVANAGEFLDGGTSVVVNGDTLLMADLAALLSFHNSAGALATLLLTADARVPNEHAVFVDADGRIRRIVGQGASPDGLVRCAFVGAHVLEPGIFEYLPREGCIIRQGYLKALDDGRPLCGFVSEGRAMDVGTPASLLAANMGVLGGSMALPHAGESLSDNRLESLREQLHSVEGPVFCGPGCAAGEDVRLGPNAVLSRNVRVGRGATISESLVLPGETIEPGETLHRVVAGFGLRISA